MRISIPSRLFSILVPVVFLGSCADSMSVVRRCGEAKLTHTMKESERENFPLLARAPSGKYVIFRREEPKNVEIIRSITGLDIDQINRDLREWRGVADHYSYFRVLSRTGSACEVVLEVPATKDWVIRGTYVLQDGKITAQRLLAYLVRALRS